MDIHSEFILGTIGTITLAILGYLLARSIAQIDESLKSVWEKLDEIASAKAIHNSKLDLAEERFKYLTERVARLEEHAKRDGSL